MIPDEDRTPIFDDLLVETFAAQLALLDEGRAS